jgi:hypothetical protein
MEADMRRLTLVILTVIAFSVVGCGTKTPVEPTNNSTAKIDIPTINTADLDRMERLAAQPDGGFNTIAHGRHAVVVPSGSNDALAAAIASAGDHGVVLLKAGSHTESGMITVDVSVSIIGEHGAQVISSAGTLNADLPTVVEPAFYVTADDVVIQNLVISSAPGDGNTAFLIQGGDDAIIFNNQINGFQYGILVNRADRVHLWSNTIVCSGAWQTGEVGDAEGIVVVNGAYASVLKNEVSNALFGIWPCGSNGQIAFNKAHDSYIGIIFCKVPDGSFLLPNGTIDGSEVSSTGWFATMNVTNNNLTTGFLAIDGANHCLMVSNASSGNGTYDIELSGDSYRFGFLTPTSSYMTFIAGLYPTIEVKDCGLHNTIIGGTLVDNTTDPCN